MGYDPKYGKVTTEHKQIPDDEPVIVFRAQDETTGFVLKAAVSAAKALGAPIDHIKSLEVQQRRFWDWQQEHGTKVPD